MKHKNVTAIDFLKKNEEFADIANWALFHGDSVIKPEHIINKTPDYNNILISPDLLNEQDLEKMVS